MKPAPTLEERVWKLEIQGHTILFLGAANLFLNFAMLVVGFMLGVG